MSNVGHKSGERERVLANLPLSISSHCVAYHVCRSLRRCQRQCERSERAVLSSLPLSIPLIVPLTVSAPCTASASASVSALTSPMLSGCTALPMRCRASLDSCRLRGMAGSLLPGVEPTCMTAVASAVVAAAPCAVAAPAVVVVGAVAAAAAAVSAPIAGAAAAAVADTIVVSAATVPDGAALDPLSKPPTPLPAVQFRSSASSCRL